MDILYHWKDNAADLKASRVGWFRSSKEKLAEFQEGCPDFIWMFRTPPGAKGRLQLLARVAWSKTATPGASNTPKEPLLHYDPDHSKSVWYLGSESEDAIERLSRWMQLHFPAAVRSNFQGVAAHQALRGHVLHGLVDASKGLQTVPFRTGAGVAH